MLAIGGEDERIPLESSFPRAWLVAEIVRMALTVSLLLHHQNMVTLSVWVQLFNCEYGAYCSLSQVDPLLLHEPSLHHPRYLKPYYHEILAQLIKMLCSYYSFVGVTSLPLCLGRRSRSLRNGSLCSNRGRRYQSKLTMGPLQGRPRVQRMNK